MSGRFRAAGIVAVAAALAALLAGCVTIPTAGGVSTQGIEQEQGTDTTIRTVSPPQAGATASEIVTGFIRAGGGPQGNYDVARQFLADSLRSKWKASAGTLVSDTSPTPLDDGSDTDSTASYSVSLAVVGQIDASGVYAPQSSTARSLSFHLVKERGQWRIDRAPDGTVLRTRDLGTVAKPYDLYFFDPAYSYLVPDLRWFADQGGTGYLPGRIVSALLAGPASWLAAPVLASAFPAATQLNSPPAPTAGAVTIDLSANVSDAGPVQQSRMLQQLDASLLALHIQRVTITANGLQVPATDASNADASPSVPYDAIGSDGKTFGPVGDTQAAVPSSLPQLGAAVQELAPLAVSLSRDRASAAVLGAGGVSLVTATAHPVVDPRPGLTAPTMDPQGWVWSAQADPGSLIAVRPDGKPVAMPVTASGRIVSTSMSRDGTRLAVAFIGDAGASLLVLGVQRDKDGAPVGFGAPLIVPVDPTRPIIDTAWVDSGSIATIAGDVSGLDTVTQYVLGGLTTSHGVVRGGTTLAAGSGGTGFNAVRVLLASGDLQQPSFVGDWQSTGVRLSLLGTQQ